MTNSADVPFRVRQLADSLAQPKPMRRGSLSERRIKCSKAGCACARDPKARHGPYYSLTRAVAGKTHSRFLSVEKAEMVRRQIAAGQEFRSRTEAYWQVCEQWADAELEQTEAAEAAEKGGFQRVSKARSRKRSKRS